jgi:hypothetical protein
MRSARAVVTALVVIGSAAAISAPAGAAASRWTITPTAAGAAFGTLSAVSCPAPGVCVAVGTQNAAGKSVKLIERWTGKKWVAQISPNPPGAQSSHLSAVQCTSGASCIAVGQYSTASATKTLALRWSDSRWSLMTTPNPAAAVSGLAGLTCSSPTSCIAVGGYFVSTPTVSNEFTLAEQWDGTKWSIMSTQNVSGAFDSVLSGVACAAPTDCFAVGYSHTTLLTSTLVEQWNGASWSIVPSPNPPNSAENELAGVACSASTGCTAVGTSDHGTLVQRWNGTVWSIVMSPNPTGATGAALTGITCPTTTRCLAAGVAFTKNVSQRLVELLTPARNSLVGVPVPSDTKRSSLSAISCANVNLCFAVGDYHSGTSARPLLLRYGP